MDKTLYLNSLLTKVAKYHPSYGGGLAMHLPMVLIALSKMNAPNTTLDHIFHTSLDNLELIDDLENVKEISNIESNLGNSQSYEGYLKYFQNELVKYSISTVLKNSLPTLITGIAASAFHALIRLAYAVEAQNKSEVAIALAYWCAEYQPFELTDKTTTETVECILTRLSPLGESHAFSPGIIVDRMDEIGRLLQERQLVIQPSVISLSALKQLALNSFYLHDDFTLLHTVTGCHAFSIILPYLKDEESGLRELWKAILVAYLSTGLKYKNGAINIESNKYDFTTIQAKALTSQDSHIIKLVYSCIKEYQECKNPLYYTVADRAVN